MNYVWPCIEIMVNVVEVGLFLYLINSKLPANNKSGVLAGAHALVVGVIGLYLIGVYDPVWIKDYLFEPIIILMYALVARKGSFLQKLFWTAIGSALIGASAILGISVGLFLPDVNMDVIMNEQSVGRMQVLIICKLLQTILFFIASKHGESGRLTNKPATAMLIVMSVASLVTVALLLDYGVSSSLTLTNQIMMVGASMFVLVINLVMFVLYDILLKQAQANIHMQTRLQHNELLMRHNEEISGLYEEMRGWRHDYHNHLQVMQGYIQLNRYDSLEEYIEKIEISIKKQKMPISSGNPLLDALVSIKMLIAEKQNVRFTAEVATPQKLEISDTDMSVLLGNLLDNAIEACQRIEDPQEERFINLEINSIKDNIHIRVKNSTNGNVRTSGAGFVSDKTGKYHGIGIKRIDEVVLKYGGYVSRSHENKVFDTNIMIPLKVKCLS